VSDERGMGAIISSLRCNYSIDASAVGVVSRHWPTKTHLLLGSVAKDMPIFRCADLKHDQIVLRLIFLSESVLAWLGGWTAGGCRASSSTMVIDKNNKQQQQQTKHAVWWSVVVVDRWWWWFASFQRQVEQPQCHLAILCTMAPLDSSLLVADLNGWLFCPRQREFLKCCLNSQFCWRETFTLFLEQGATTGDDDAALQRESERRVAFSFSSKRRRWTMVKVKSDKPAFNPSPAGNQSINQLRPNPTEVQTKSFESASGSFD